MGKMKKAEIQVRREGVTTETPTCLYNKRDNTVCFEGKFRDIQRDGEVMFIEVGPLPPPTKPELPVRIDPSLAALMIMAETMGGRHLR